MDLRIHEGRVFTFGFDKEEEIRRAKGSRTGLSNLPDECRESIVRTPYLLVLDAASRKTVELSVDDPGVIRIDIGKTAKDRIGRRILRS